METVGYELNNLDGDSQERQALLLKCEEIRCAKMAGGYDTVSEADVFKCKLKMMKTKNMNVMVYVSMCY